MNFLTDYRFGIGAVSKNTVDACIEYANAYDRPIALIASRNQVEWSGGYVNNWTTESFCSYAAGKSSNILLCRDHGGPNQGAGQDDGLASLSHDCLSFDIIHIDPWKAAKDFHDGCYQTEMFLQTCYYINPDVCYEIGTEQAIFPYEPAQLEALILFLKERLPAKQFERIAFAVIQSGTALHAGTNTGSYDSRRLEDMLKICRQYGLKSKTHNGDWLPSNVVADHFQRGLDAMNIAPEFGQIETDVYLEEIKGKIDLLEFLFICYRSHKWERWIGKKIPDDIKTLIRACGHYVFSSPEFLVKIKSKVRKDIDNIIKERMIARLEELHGNATAFDSNRY